MGKNYKCVLFCSRNKDNEHLMKSSFVQRKRSFIVDSDYDEEKLQKKFEEFVRAGCPGEFSRCYVSVNSRDGELTTKKLMHYLVDHMDDVDLTHMEALTASFAMQPECASSHYWMFDVDFSDPRKLDEFMADVRKYVGFTLYDKPTPHGYCVVVPHGFDTRELLEKYPDVTLLRDGLKCVDWGKKEE